jgi:hypothetical protein
VFSIMASRPRTLLQSEAVIVDNARKVRLRACLCGV